MCNIMFPFINEKHNNHSIPNESVIVTLFVIAYDISKYIVKLGILNHTGKIKVLNHLDIRDGHNVIFLAFLIKIRFRWF